jgi:manganese/iron transport system ATP-binding protein
MPRYVEHKKGAKTLAVSGLTVLYNGTPALDDLSLEIDEGQRIAVLGPNGAGKSTLLKVIAGVLKPTRGDVRVFGHGPCGHACIAYVPQRTAIDWSFPVTVYDVVMMGRTGRLGLVRRPRSADHDMVNRSIETVGLRALADRQISELSGGQQQRMFLARALAQEAELMLMDEPVAGLDLASEEQIFGILKQLSRDSVTSLVAMHDLATASDHFDRVLLLNRRSIGFGRPQDVFTRENLVTAYGGHVRMIEDPEGAVAFSDTCCDGSPHRR